MNISQTVIFPELLDAIRVIPPDQKIYLVGGAIRDVFLKRPAHDLDFVLSGDPKPIARRVANSLDAALYLLDDERNTVRLIYPGKDGSRYTLDFAALRGPDLEADLRGRDFTINAIAVDVTDSEETIDPTGGVADLLEKRLRLCSDQALDQDPLRVLRGVRLAVDLSFQIEPDTRQRMRQGVPLLPNVSMERKRDELFKILDGSQPTTAFRLLDWLGSLLYLLPELTGLQGVRQTPPHTLDVWEHTLAVLQSLQVLLDVLASDNDLEKHANYLTGLASLRLGRYRPEFERHFSAVLNPNRSLTALLSLAALYHDVAKPGTAQVDHRGKIHNYGHEKIGAEIVFHRAQALQLSNAECDRLRTIVRHHMRIHQLVQTGEAPTRRAVYRFFRDTGPVGVDICLLSLADTLGTYGSTLPQETWMAYLDTCRILLESWWEKKAETVLPEPIMNGHDLQELLGIRPGPRLGMLLEALREAQATGQVQDREAALEFAQKWQRQYNK